MEIVSMLENIEITIHFRDANEPKTILGYAEIPSSKDKRLSFRSVTFLISSCSYRTFQWERGEIFQLATIVTKDLLLVPQLASLDCIAIVFYGSFVIRITNFRGRTKFAFFLIYYHLR